MSTLTRMKSSIGTRQAGIVIVENLVALLIFSVGILGLVGLLAASVRNVSNAQYRNEASVLANQIIGQMWVDDKSNTALRANYASPNGPRFATWQANVESVLPGTEANPPVVEISSDNMVTVRVRWQLPGEQAAHSYAVRARING